jgi:hypothetical protein
VKAPGSLALSLCFTAVVAVGCSPSGSDDAGQDNEGGGSCATVIAISGNQYIGGRQSDAALPLTEETTRAERLSCDDMGAGAGTSMTTVVATTIEGVRVEDAVAAVGHRLMLSERLWQVPWKDLPPELQPYVRHP